MRNKNAVYSPVLRLKQGEYNALVSITTAVADKIAPRFVLPPPKDRDPETKRVLSQDEFIHNSGKRIGQYWPMRLCFVEARYLFKKYGMDNVETWLPRLFEVARNANGLPVPIASLDEAVGAANIAFKKTIPSNLDIKLGLRVCFADLDDNLKPRITQALATLGISSKQCVVFLDFADADLSDPDAVSEFLGGAVQTLQEVGVWARIFFQGTNFPEKNPADPDSVAKVPRTEWQAWSRLVKKDKDALQWLAFGDYGADSAKFLFQGGPAIPIRHLRYCSDQEWLVARGLADVPQDAAIMSVAKNILRSGSFLGRDFSRSDDRIYRMANGLASGGNAQIWREINTAHHITKVVSDLGRIYGFTIEPNEVEEEPVQTELLLL